MRAGLPALAALVLAAASLSACGSQSGPADVEGSASVRRGAQLFSERCSGCHQLSLVGAEGGAVKVTDQERTDAPNFDVRPESRDQILYAIRNGGFSGAIMPENIVVGADAEAVADFLARYAGRDAE